MYEQSTQNIHTEKKLSQSGHKVDAINYKLEYIFNVWESLMDNLW